MLDSDVCKGEKTHKEGGQEVCVVYVGCVRRWRAVLEMF